MIVSIIHTYRSIQVWTCHIKQSEKFITFIKVLKRTAFTVCHAHFTFIVLFVFAFLIVNLSPCVEHEYKKLKVA